MKKNLLLFLLCVCVYTNTNSQVSRLEFSDMVFDLLYQANPNPNDYDAVSFPNPFNDIGGNSTLFKQVLILSYLDYGDGIPVFYRNNNFYPAHDISRGEAIKTVVEAWNIPNVFYINSPFNDVFPGDDYYGYLCSAYDYGMISGGTINPNHSIGNNEAQDYMTWAANSAFHPVSSNTLSNLDNYFIPNNYQPNNIGFLRGIEQGVFSHYAKNSFVIPDRKFNLNFSHYYSTQLVELPRSYFPVEPLGRGWTHTYNTYIIRENNVGADEIDYYYIKWADGSIDIYNQDDEEYVTKGVYDELEEVSGSYDIVITKKNQVKYYFDRYSIPGPDEPIFYLEKIEDPNGNEILLSYEESDVNSNFARLEKVTAPSGKELHFYYHNNTDFVKRIEDPINREIRFEYNEERLKYFYDAKNQETKYYYVSNDEDAPQQHQYKRFLLRRVKLPNGNSIRAEYDDDDNGKLTEYTINDNATTYIDVDPNYDSSSPMTAHLQVPMPNGSMQDYDYEFNDYGMVTSFQNDTQDVSINYPDPTDTNSLLPTNIDNHGLDIHYTYDSRGNIKSKQIENNEDEDFWYDSNNNLTHYRDSNGNNTYFNYDNDNNLTSVQDALGNYVYFNYDSHGQVLSVTNQEGITVNYTYEDDGALQTITAPENLTSSFSYDGINRLISQTVNGQTSSIGYDPNDNIISQTNIGGLTTTFDYDANDNLVSITNANGVATTFTYNNKDQVTSENFNGLTKQYEYNDDGTLDKYIKPSGDVIEYDYLSNGNFNDAGTITDVDYYGSNGGKREGLIESIATDDIRYNFDYDSLNRLDEVENNSTGDKVRYEYDAVGNITRIYYPNAGNNTYVNYSYDAKNRLSVISFRYFGSITTFMQYFYRDDDQISYINNGVGILTKYYYDNAGRKIGISHQKFNDSFIYNEQLTLDNQSNIISDNRFYGESETNEEIQKYSLQNEGYSYNNNNHLTQFANESVNIDNDGNTLLRGQFLNFEYDIDDRLITTNDGFNPYFNNTYSYDAYGNRTKIVNDYFGTTNFTWDIINNNLIELQSDGNHIFYVYGASGLECAINAVNGNVIKYYHGDIRGSVVFTSNANGNIISNGSGGFIKYDDFGKIVHNGSGGFDSFGYLGKHGARQIHNDEGLYYIKARYYDAKLGRFLTQDPIWSTNLYPYSNNNPISRIDPSGKTDNSVITPIGVGLEFVSGLGPRHRNFSNGDYFTQLLQEHNHVNETRGIIIHNLSNGGDTSGKNSYSLAGIGGINQYIKDYSGVFKGNVGVAYLGSYTLRWEASNITSNSADITFNVNNSSTFQSLTRPPYLGYKKWWQDGPGTYLNNQFKSGPLSKTTQSFNWTETITWD